MLAHRAAPWWAALLAMVLTLPSLTVGWFQDDHFHRLAIKGQALPSRVFSSRLDIFCFFDGDPERTYHMMDVGYVPWWTYQGIRAAFWRPLTSVTHWLDYTLWPTTPALMHLQSILWYGLAVAAAGLLFREILGPVWIAGLAALLYAIDDAHGMPVGWLANRNTLLATAFGCFCVLAHIRWRRHGWRAGVVLGPVLLVLSLLSAEAGIGACAYLGAYALVLDRGPLMRRLATLVPYVAIVVAWRLVWNYLGYGTVGLGLYVDPVAEPVRYLWAILQRTPLLLLAQGAVPPADLSFFISPASLRWVWVFACLYLVTMAVLLWPMYRQFSTTRFWVWGGLLATLPICATFPSDRLLFFVGLSGMALLAQLWPVLFSRGPHELKLTRLNRVYPVLGVLTILLHVIWAPVFLMIRSGHPGGSPEFLASLQIRIPFDDSIVRKDLIVVNAPSPLHAQFFALTRELEGKPRPHAIRVLAPAIPAVSIYRSDDRSLVVQPEEGFLNYVFDTLFRDQEHALKQGEQVVLTGMTATVTELTTDGRPAEVVFRFDVPLDDPSLVWLEWKDMHYMPFAPPAVGQTLILRPDPPPLIG